jgi:PRC-barrel domain
MRQATLVAAIFTTVSSVALAQAGSAATTPSKTTSAAQPANNVRQQVMTNLQQSGFTDVKVLPDSFLVHAKDRSGNPVTMFIGPNSFDEVTTVGSNADTSRTTSNASAGMFASLPAQADLSSKIVGLDVYNDAKQDIGTIKDIAYTGNTVDGYILSVGGFLGLGDHYVVVRPSAVNVNYSTNDNKWHATINASAEQLKAAPEYKYSSKT